ncbi:unnamed protein product, partial [Prorocentrum cordatum]
GYISPWAHPRRRRRGEEEEEEEERRAHRTTDTTKSGHTLARARKLHPCRVASSCRLSHSAERESYCTADEVCSRVQQAAVSEQMRRTTAPAPRAASSLPGSRCSASAGTKSRASASATVLTSRCVRKVTLRSWSRYTAWPPRAACAAGVLRRHSTRSLVVLVQQQRHPGAHGAAARQGGRPLLHGLAARGRAAGRGRR